MREYFELPEMLSAERREIEALKKEDRELPREELMNPEPLPGEDKESRLRNLFPKLHKAKSVALCFSGGGIRSATFNLGVLQSLARMNMLKEVDYLSTVSGGGYIGSWFTSWLSQQKGTAAEKVRAVSDTLAGRGAPSPCNEPYQVRFLRDYSNYLTPRVGLLSLDTWAMVGTYLRNLLLNWLVLLPLLFAVLLLPRILSSLMSGARPGDNLLWILLAAGIELGLYLLARLPDEDAKRPDRRVRSLQAIIVFLVCALLAGIGYGTNRSDILLAVGGVLGIFPIAYTFVDLPSVGNRKQYKQSFVALSLVPLILMACALAAYWGAVYRPGCHFSPVWYVVFGIGVHLMGTLAGWIYLKLSASPKQPDLPTPKHVATFAGCAILTGAFAGYLAWLAATKTVPALLELTSVPKLLYATISVPIVLAVYLLTGTLVVAILSRCTGDQDREWWARAGGVIMLVGLAWAALMALVIYGPWLILPDSGAFWNKAYAVGSGVLGVAVALFGKDSSTPANRPAASMGKLRTTLLAVAAVVFLLFLVQLFSLLASAILWFNRYVHDLPVPCLPNADLSCAPLPDLTAVSFGLGYYTHISLICSTPVVEILAMIAIFAAVSLLAAWLVNINKFSLHAMYRNRLVRCYLGATRTKEERKPNPFTGFDDEDDFPMCELPHRPFHVVNIAWNLVKGKRLAWQQRKAASFIMTPLFAGGDLGPTDKEKAQDPGAPETKPEREGESRDACLPGGYRDMRLYGAGKHGKADPIHLGTAVAISGAAASPNMGYHSSPLVTFVMALFNVRLGWWLGNPGKGMGAWRMASPGLAIRPLLKETFGLTSEDNNDIYLSDGGHFENLALYEMVRRRCRYIIVSDAGCDCPYHFEDLGNAVRKVRADFGIEIEIDVSAIRAKKAHFALGKIKYSECDATGEEIEDGELLYIKPVMTDDEPIDDDNYSRTHEGFPHEPTSDQWFDEAQFESYRKLGEHSLQKLVNALSQPKDQNIPSLFGQAGRGHQSAVKEAAEVKVESERPKASGATRKKPGHYRAR